jgi:hypothetical protein
MPASCVHWLRDYHNSFHQGAAKNFCDVLVDVLHYEESWTAHREAEGITARTRAYEARYWEWIQSQFEQTKDPCDFAHRWPMLLSFTISCVLSFPIVSLLLSPPETAIGRIELG